MTAEIIAFNPLDTRNLGAAVAEALLACKPRPLGDLAPFIGAGIYVIYYTGTFAPYDELRKRNADGKFSVPIYAGKAIPEGARKGGTGRNTAGKPLFTRLKQHADSIRAVENLRIEDFFCRLLVVEDIWIPLGESLIIARFAPLWNAIVDGFGNHDPGRGRHAGLRPRWDVLHPGRAWADKCVPRAESANDIARDVQTFLASITFPTTDRFIGPQMD